MEKINQLKQIIESHSYQEIEGKIVDVQTANIILKVYEALGEKNKENFVTQSIDRMAHIAWKLVS